jgi:tetratricopeptide (TPR) repeat protein
LADAFALYEQAMTLETDEEGWCIVASFEGDEQVIIDGRRAISAVGELPLVCSAAFAVAPTDEWATHGEHSLRLTADKIHGYMTARIADPDWRFKDWTRFSRLEMDLLLEADEPQELCVLAADDVWEGHGRIPIHRLHLPPGEELHISLELTPDTLAGEPAWNVPYFDGSARAKEIADLFVQVPRPTGPFTLYLDGIRFALREDDPRNMPPPPQPAATATPEPPATDTAPPPTADTAQPDEVTSEEDKAQAAAEVRAALAAKQVGKFKEAEEHLRRAIELDGASVEAHRVLAWTLSRQGRKAEAAEEFRKVLELTQDEQIRKEATDALQRLE